MTPPQWAPRWPWDDRGRSALTEEKIKEQALEARRLYERMFPGVLWSH